MSPASARPGLGGTHAVCRPGLGPASPTTADPVCPPPAAWEASSKNAVASAAEDPLTAPDSRGRGTHTASGADPTGLGWRELRRGPGAPQLWSEPRDRPDGTYSFCGWRASGACRWGEAAGARTSRSGPEAGSPGGGPPYKTGTHGVTAALTPRQPRTCIGDALQTAATEQGTRPWPKPSTRGEETDPTFPRDRSVGIRPVERQ